MSSYYTQLLYQGLRRRVTARLSPIVPLLLHCVVFVLVVYFASGQRVVSSWSGWPYFVHPDHAALVAFWSIGLFAHAARAFLRSGIWTRAREQAIRDELEQFDQQQVGIHLANDDVSRLEAALNDEIARSNRLIIPLSIFATLNMILWVIWSLTTPRIDASAWSGSIQLAFISFFALGITELVRLRKHTANELTDVQIEAEKAKQKHSDDEEEKPKTTHYVLGDDGEIFPISTEDEVEQQRQQRTLRM